MSEESFNVSRHDWELLLQRVAKLEKAIHTESVSKEIAVADQAGKQLTKAKRGARLPEGWTPSDETIEKMCDELHTTPHVLVREHRKFCDYFYSVPGQKGVKLDWDRTWCNWMRTASERGSLYANHATARTNADKSREWMEMGERYAEGE